MNQKTKTIIRGLAFIFVFSISLLAIQTFAVFTPPTGNPLSNNIATPINSSSALQRKEGGLIVEFFRSMGLTLVGGNLEVAGTVKISGGNPGTDRILVSDATGLASWRDASSIPGLAGSNGNNGTNGDGTLSGSITGTGTPNYIPKFLTPSTIGNSIMAELAGKIGIGTASPQDELHVIGKTRISTLAGTGDRQVCVDTNGTLKRCSSDVNRVITFSVKYNGPTNGQGLGQFAVEKTHILYTNDPDDFGKEVKLCNFGGSFPYKFTAHFDASSASCTASTGDTIDSDEIVSAHYVSHASSSQTNALTFSNNDPADKVEFFVYKDGNQSILWPGDELYFIVEWPSVGINDN